MKKIGFFGNINKSVNQNGLVCTFFVMCLIIFTALRHDFFSAGNFHSILLTAVPVGLIAIGECICIMGGYFEMSVGMVSSIAGLCCAYAMEYTGSVLLSLSAGIIFGVLAGMIAGLAVSRLNMNAFITTFALQEIYRGFLYMTTSGMSKSLVAPSFDPLTKWGQMRVVGVQFPIWVMLLIYLISALFMKYTQTGRKIYLIGNNAKAAYIGGIDVHNTRLLLFIICDVLAAIAGMLVTMRTASAAPFGGGTYCMEAIAATILGGTSMMGGKGNLWMTFLGVIIIYVIKNGLIMIGLQDYYQYVAIGAILIFAVIIQTDKKKA